MFRMLIVDDEPIVRYGIHFAIDWNAMGVDVAGEADNAADALGLMKLHHPDIVLCDIKMPGQDGLSLVNAAREQFPNTRFILVSGYSDRDYMLNAIRYGICDYLLKPLDMDQLRAAVEKVCQELYRQSEERQQIRKDKKYLYDNLNILRVHFLDRLFTGKTAEVTLREDAATLSLTLPGPKYLLLLTQAKKEDDWNLIQELEFVFKKYSPVASPCLKSRYVAVVLNVEDTPSGREFDTLSKTCLALSRNIAGIVAVSPLCDSVLDFGRHYAGLAALAERGIWYDKGEFRFLEQEKFAEFPREGIREKKNRLLQALRDKQPESEVKRLFDEYLRGISEAKPAYSIFTAEMAETLQAIRILYNIEVFEPMPSFASAEEARQAFHRLYGIVSLPQNAYRNSLCGRIVQYIEKNYTDNLTLEKISEELYLSQYYVSRLLKEKTGRGFQEWLHYFRIEKAKELLNTTDYTANRVAELVGYSSYKLFSEHFKIATQTTAMAYKKK